MEYINGMPVFGKHDENTIKQATNVLKFADRVSLMADGHYGYGVPIGGVVAAVDRVSPSAVGYDIACGNKAVLTDMKGEDLRPKISTIMDDIYNHIAFGVGRKNGERVDHAIFDENYPGWETEAANPIRDKAQAQLGTVGSGNHYVDLFTDEQDRVWIVVHFGSRGLGHGIATWFLKKLGAVDSMDADPVFLDVNSDLGDQYVKAMTLAGDYAYAGRDWVCSRVAAILGAKELESVHNHHNYAWLENHSGQNLWVCRKGATPAFPGQKGFVGGTMGENSVILKGAPSPFTEEWLLEGPSLQELTMFSTVHGAGRVMGRKQAAGVWKKGVCTREGLVKSEQMREWLDRAKVELRGGGLDESPDCYKRLNEVLEAQGPTINILHTLTPVGVAMAGANEFDPYKD